MFHHNRIRGRRRIFRRKLSLSPDVGGNLPEILGYDRTVELLNESDNIYLKFGADTNVRSR